MAYANPEISRYRRKHVRALIDALEAELGGKLSPAQRELAQRAAYISLSIEDVEKRVLAGDDVDPALLCMLGNAQRRMLRALGLHREPPSAPEPPLESSPEDDLVERYRALDAKSGKAAA
jgi:hypothetical protein